MELFSIRIQRTFQLVSTVNTVKSLKKSAYTSLREQLKDPMLFLLFLLIG